MMLLPAREESPRYWFLSRQNQYALLFKILRAIGQMRHIYISKSDILRICFWLLKTSSANQVVARPVNPTTFQTRVAECTCCMGMDLAVR